MTVPLFGSESLIFYFFVVDAVDRDHHRRRHPGRNL